MQRHARLCAVVARVRDEPFIQSVRQRIRIPEVIALTKFDAMPTQTVTFSRRNVFKRDKML